MSEKNPFLGATFAERKKIRETAEGKQVDAEVPEVEDKAIKPKPRGAKKQS